jgi:ATP-dependent Lhr-like helicase
MRTLWVATERLPELLAIHPAAIHSPPVRPSAGPPPDDALRELLRGRLEILGPVTASELAVSIGVSGDDVDIALAQLEREGVILRGSFTPGTDQLEWCERRLLARIHRYTLNRLRAEIAPVTAAEYMRFLFAWQRVEPEQRVRGLEGLAEVVNLLDGYEAPAGAWESELLSSRCDDYDPMLLDTLCLTGRVAWGRLSRGGQGTLTLGSANRPIRSSPIALFLRANAAHWLRLRDSGEAPLLSSYAREVLEVLERRGACFFTDLVQEADLLATQTEQALAELAAAGLITSDSFAGLRALITPSSRRGPIGMGVGRRRPQAVTVEGAGRWSLLRTAAPEGDDEPAIVTRAWAYLRRYGIVFRRVLARESAAIPWRRLALVYRRLEARGEIRGGRFVSGMSGEQFALPEAVGQLRAIRRSEARGQLQSISAADPLNLIGIVTPGERVAALRRNRVVFEDGVPLAALVSGELRRLAEYDNRRGHEIERVLVRRGGWAVRRLSDSAARQADGRGD